MNQDQIKEKLLRIERDIPDFSVILSGKKSKKVDGLYKPDTKEIIIHNRNTDNNNELMHTAIHELAHHVQFSRAVKPISSRCHTTEFWNIFHSMLTKAEELRIYENVFATNEEFVKLTDTIKTQLLAKNGSIMKEFGKMLVKAKDLCDKHKVSFFDYIERVLSLPRSSAKTLIKAYSYDIPPQIGFDNMKTVARISDKDKRKEAETAIMEGASPYLIKSNFLSPKKEEGNPVEVLMKEKKDIEKRISMLKTKLAMIQKRIEEMESE
jgi:hypothetical protein